LVFDVFRELCVPALAAGFFPVLFADPVVTFVPALEAGFFPAVEGGLTPGFPRVVFRGAVGLAGEAVLDVDDRPAFLTGPGSALAALFSSNGACTAFSEAFIFLGVPAFKDFDLLVLVGEVGFLEETVFVTNAALATLVLRAFG
jgi:hypothetical protein